MGKYHLIESLGNYPVSLRRHRLITSNVAPLNVVHKIVSQVLLTMRTRLRGFIVGTELLIK